MPQRGSPDIVTYRPPPRASHDGVAPRDDGPTLREVVEALAPLEKLAGSPGEQQAAEWLAGRLARAGAPARVEQEEFLDGFAALLAGLSAAGVAAAALGLSGRARALAAALGAAATAAIVDDASNGPRVVRRLVGRKKPTWNVVAETGDPQAERTLVVLAHHDTARTGQIFKSPLQPLLAEMFPGVVERIDTSLPLWWPIAAGPALAAAGALSRRRGLTAGGAALSALSTALSADIARSPVVPGANDNLSACALLVALAERLHDRPVQGLRVLLVSCGAEEVLQGGIYGFLRRHGPSLDRQRTYFLNFDTIGSPELTMLEGEGPFVMEDYFHRPFRDLVERTADKAGAPVRRGMRSRFSTDSVVVNRHGYANVCFASIDRYKALSNYHLMSDTPDNLDYRTVQHGVVIADAVVRELALPPAR